MVRRLAIYNEWRPSIVFYFFMFSLSNVSECIRWSLDLRWQKTGQPCGLWGLKDGVRMRSSDPSFKEIDWETFNETDRNKQQFAYLEQVMFFYICVNSYMFCIIASVTSRSVWTGWELVTKDILEQIKNCSWKTIRYFHWQPWVFRMWIHRYGLSTTVKPVYNDHLVGYFSAFWSPSRWPGAT